MTRWTDVGRRHVRRAGTVGALSIVLVLSAGCGDDDPDEDAAGTDTAAAVTSAPDDAGQTDSSDGDECLLTNDEVNEVTGLDMVPIEPMQASGCGFEIPLDKSAGIHNPPNAGAQVFYRQTSPNAIEAFLQAGGEPVEGLGDEAVFDDLARAIVVTSGDRTFEIQVIAAPGDLRAQAVALAEAALANA